MTVSLTPRRKLIEVAMPLDAINKASAKEKSIRHGHPSTLHLWWARRPLAACRAVLFAQMVDDPSAWPERFPDEAAQKVERDRLHGVIERLVPWEASNDQTVLGAARWEIARSLAWSRGEEPPLQDQSAAVLAYLHQHAPPVCDPFCGGGSIPLEAQRLGLRVIASDLNPVAVLITKALVEIPPLFAGRAPVHPDARAETARGGQWQGRGAAGLADDVRRYGAWIRDEACKRIGHLYPAAEMPGGREATVIAWIWARTVRSPNPAARGAMVPLSSSFLVSAKAGKETWLEPVVDATTARFHFIVHVGGTKEQVAAAKLGTRGGKASDFACLITGAPIPRDYIRSEGKAGRLGAVLLATVVEGHRAVAAQLGSDAIKAEGRSYLAGTPEMEAAARAAECVPIVEDARRTFLSGNTPTRAMITGGVCSAYGLSTWGHLFTARQLVALTTFADLVNEVRRRIALDAADGGWSSDSRPLAEGGNGAQAYADAVATYLALAVGKAADRNTSLCVWEQAMDRMRGTFGRQAIPMVWDYVETNPFAGSGGDYEGCCISVAKVLTNLGNLPPAQVNQKNASAAHKESVTYSTDPPYYDNIVYADLSDFFYAWLRRSAQEIHPSIFSTLLTPKAEELIASPFRHGGKAEADAFFLNGMQQVLGRMAEAANPSTPLTLYYAFKQSEKNDEGVASTGWATFLQAVHDAGLIIDGTWPMRTELATRSVGMGANALASSIILVCRRRATDATTIARGAFLAALRRELPPAAKLLRDSALAATDFEQAIIGPGMAVFTRHSAVLESDDTPMPVKTALALINQVLDEEEAEVDAATRFALTWFATHGFDERAYGDADNLARARDVGVDAMAQAGVLASGRGKVRLRRREEWPEGFDVAVDVDAPAWMLANGLAHALDRGGEVSAASLLARLGARAEPVRDLAYRLFLLAERKKLSAEAGIWNALAVAWPDLMDQARAAQDSAAPAQAALAF
jgi:putative DNA methylase